MKIKDLTTGLYFIAEVINFGSMDNNRLKYKTMDGRELYWTAECSEIVLKIEQRYDKPSLV